MNRIRCFGAAVMFAVLAMTELLLPGRADAALRVRTRTVVRGHVGAVGATFRGAAFGVGVGRFRNVAAFRAVGFGFNNIGYGFNRFVGFNSFGFNRFALGGYGNAFLGGYGTTATLLPAYSQGFNVAPCGGAVLNYQASAGFTASAGCAAPSVSYATQGFAASPCPSVTASDRFVEGFSVGSSLSAVSLRMASIEKGMGQQNADLGQALTALASRLDRIEARMAPPPK